MIATEWSNPTTEPNTCTCTPGQLCPGCSALLMGLCRTSDPLARIAASLNRPDPKRAIA